MEGMLYMSSACSNDGSYRLTVTFEIGTDLDKAQVLVQNRLAVALPRLPQEVQRLGVIAQKQSTNFLMADRPDLARRPVRRAVPGQLRHAPDQEHAEPDTLAWGVATSSAAAGTACGSGSTPRGSRRATCRPRTCWRRSASKTSRWRPARSASRPCRTTQGFQYNVTTPGRLRDAEQFGDIIVKVDDSDPRRAAADPAARRGPRRAGRRGIRPVERDRRPVRGRPRDLTCSPAPTPSTSPGGSRRPWRS